MIWDEWQVFSCPETRNPLRPVRRERVSRSALVVPALGHSRPAKQQGDQKVGLKGLPVRHDQSFLPAFSRPVKHDFAGHSVGCAPTVFRSRR
jgi:hypothetical protein